MEEDIDYLKRHIKAIGKTRSTEAIENLINKNKELEKMVEKFKNYSKSVYDDYANAVVELQEKNKMIELMADKIYNISSIADMLDYDLEKFFNGIDDKEVLQIIIDYFRKKAKGE